MKHRPDEKLLAIQGHFHEVIRGRVGDLIQERGVELPELTDRDATEESPCWFPVPGMCGGFSYWFEGEGDGDEARLVTESWCRGVQGSGQRHEITAEGGRLVKEGFA